MRSSGGLVSPAVRAGQFVERLDQGAPQPHSTLERTWQGKVNFLAESAMAICQVLNQHGYLADVNTVEDPKAHPASSLRIRLRSATAAGAEAEKWAEAVFYLGVDGQVYGCWLPFGRHPATSGGQRNCALDHPIGELESVEDYAFGHAICAFFEWAITGRGRGAKAGPGTHPG